MYMCMRYINNITYTILNLHDLSPVPAGHY